MDTAATSVRYVRAHHRLALPSLTYVVLDDANGGIIRNLNHRGAAIQAVGALRPREIVRLRFELQRPRLRVEARAEVIWANPAGQCGLRFLDLPPGLVRQINEWTFGTLLQRIPQHSIAADSIFGAAPRLRSVGETDGLMVSPTARRVILIEPVDTPRNVQAGPREISSDGITEYGKAGENDAPEALDWLSQPLSGRTLAWVVDVLLTISAFLVFTIVFLSIAHELPRWPLSLVAGIVVALFVAAVYWLLLRVLGGPSLGSRLAELADAGEHEQEMENRIRFR